MKFTNLELYIYRKKLSSKRLSSEEKIYIAQVQLCSVDISLVKNSDDEKMMQEENIEPSPKIDIHILDIEWMNADAILLLAEINEIHSLIKLSFSNLNWTAKEFNDKSHMDGVLETSVRFEIYLYEYFLYNLIYLI